MKVAIVRRFAPLVLSLCGTLWLAEFAHGALLWGLLRPVMEQDLEWVGRGLSLYFLFELLLKLPSGRLVDRIGSRLPLLLGLLVSTLSVGLIYFATYVHPDRLLVLAGCAIQGVGAAPLWPAVIAALVNRTPESRRGQIMGNILTAWMAGLGAGYLVANTLLYRHFQHLNGTAWTWGLTCGAWVLAALWGTWSTQRLTVIPGALATEVPLHLPLDAARAGRLRALAAGLLIQTMSLGLLAPIFATYIEENTDLPAPLLMVIGGLPAALLLAPLGRMADRVGKRRSVITGLAVTSGLLFTAAALPIVPWPALRFLVAIPIVAILGLAYALLLPAWHALVMAQVENQQRGQVFSLFMSVEGIAVAAGTYLSGVLAKHLWIGAPFVASATALSLLTIAYSAGHVLPQDVALPERDEAPMKESPV
ncbi:MAG: MFS transporter [Armatimonadetes bacterium]|nr:MFS transporter [Armatimonadota bacterium]